MDYSNSFTLSEIESIINSGKNTVIASPAGTGKTSAIRSYLVKYVKNLTRKVIYVAPTKSLLDDMYNALIEIGIKDHLIFNYHSSSKDYQSLVTNSHQQNKITLNELVDRKLKQCRIILITHKRMMFEAPSRFTANGIGDWLSTEGITEDKPLVFLDEAIQPCIIATMDKDRLSELMMAAKLIAPGSSSDDYRRNVYFDDIENQFIRVNTPEEAINSYKKNFISLATYLTTRRYQDRDGIWKIKKPSRLNISLSDTCGFEGNLYDSVIEARLINLYQNLAKQICLGEGFGYKSVGNYSYINLPIALHQVWENLAQVITMDATAPYSKSLYDRFELDFLNNWNYDKLTNYVYHSNAYTKSKVTNKLDNLLVTLDEIDLTKYNKIYMVTCKDFIQPVFDQLKTKYPNYRIVSTSLSNNVENTDVISDIDYDSDEEFQGYDQDKIIYLSNYGQTRGSNVFRDCDCVVQLVSYRYPPDLLNLIRKVYVDLDDLELPMANYIQELYRGCIRCDKPMTSYSVIDDEIYEFITKHEPNLKFIECNINKPEVEIKSYGKQDKLAQYIITNYKNGSEFIEFSKLMEVTGATRANNLVTAVKVLNNNHPEFVNIIDQQYLIDEFGSNRSLKLKIQE